MEKRVCPLFSPFGNLKKGGLSPIFRFTEQMEFGNETLLQIISSNYFDSPSNKRFQYTYYFSTIAKSIGTNIYSSYVIC